MRTRILAVLATGLLVAGCARTTQIESTGDVALSSTPADSRALPAGTTLDVTLDQEIGTKVSKVGDTFSGTVSTAVVAANGETVVPAGSKIYGKVTGLDNSDHAGEPAAIKVDFEQIEIGGVSDAFNASVTATILQTRGADAREETLRKAGVGAAAGAILGAVLSGGDLQKILIGGALGAAAGTAISLGTGDVEAVLPAGTKMTLQTTRTVALR